MSFETGEIIKINSPIDVHTHLREPGGTHKETIDSGTRAALAGGYQAVFDMPNNPGGNETWTLDKLEEKYYIAEHTAQTNIGFYAGANLAQLDPDETVKMIPKAAGLKLYFGHTTGNTVEYVLDHARPVIDSWITYGSAPGQRGEQPPILIHAREGVGAEVADYVASQNWPVHWCHVSTESEVKLTQKLRQKHTDLVSAGVTPHHLTMTSLDADFKYGWPGARMMPPLASEADHDMLVYGYNTGVLNILETDHAPHTEKEKMAAEQENPEGRNDVDCVTCFGVSGIEFVLPIMMSLVQRKKITMERLEDSLYTQPAKLLGLTTKDRATTTLKIGPHVIEEQDRVGKSSNNPYVGWTGWAKVMEVKIDKVTRFRHQAYPPVFKPQILRAGSKV